MGPLTNPAGAQKYLLGVFDPSFIRRMADALVELGAKRAYVVSSYDGMDEIGISGKSAYAFVENGTVTEGEIDPEAYGFTLAPKEDILGGDAVFNAQITRDILAGKEQGAKRDIVILNAAFALFANGGVESIDEAIVQIKAQLQSGKALDHLDRMANLSQQLA